MKKISKLALAFFVIGFVLLNYSESDITGAVIGTSARSGLNLIIGLFFVLVSVVLFTSSKKQHIVSTIEELVKLGVPKQKIDVIQTEIKRHYTKMNKEERAEVYQETADVIKYVKSSPKLGEKYHTHIMAGTPKGLSNNLPKDVVLLEADAPVLNRYEHQKGRGTERYIFDADSKELLGVGYHPRGDARDIKWRVRF